VIRDDEVEIQSTLERMETNLMAKITPSEVKRVISAMKNRRELALLQANRERRAQILASQRKVEKRLQPLLTKVGLDLNKIEKIETILVENQKELRRTLEKRTTHVDKVFARIKDTFRHAIDARVKALELANRAKPRAAPTFILLDTPFFIWAEPSNWLIDSHVSRKESFAKVRFTESAKDQLPRIPHRVSFYYVWQNDESDTTALLNVATYLVLKGWCEASVGPPDLRPIPARADLDVSAELALFEWWNQPPTSPLFQKSQTAEALSLTASAFGPFSSGDTETENVFNGYDPRYSLFAVPPKGVAVFQVSMNTLYSVYGSGFFIADFSFRDSLVLCPYLQLELVTSF